MATGEPAAACVVGAGIALGCAASTARGAPPAKRASSRAAREPSASPTRAATAECSCSAGQLSSRAVRSRSTTGTGSPTSTCTCGSARAHSGVRTSHRNTRPALPCAHRVVQASGAKRWRAFGASSRNPRTCCPTAGSIEPRGMTRSMPRVTKGSTSGGGESGGVDAASRPTPRRTGPRLRPSRERVPSGKMCTLHAGHREERC
jgi:hypothetical protein